MRFPTLSRILLLLLAVAALAAGPVPGRADAASIQPLVTAAEHDTNTVNTLVHHDVTNITTPQGTIHWTARGAEDEVRNREQDHESVTVTRNLSGGKTQQTHYTVDLIFMNGSTYYRTSSAPNQWKIQKGMQFADPFTGGWKRGRTMVTFPSSVKFTRVGTSGGQTHVRATVANANNAGTIDMWISGGSKPYVARLVENYHAVKKGTSGSVRSEITFGPYNSPISIQPPAQGST